MLLVSMFSMALPAALILINSTIAKKLESEREELSPFECGFDPKSSARLPFSVNFYMIALIFLIFDVEITFIMPMPISINISDSSPFMPLSLLFILILLAGLYHEWNQGALN